MLKRFVGVLLILVMVVNMIGILTPSLMAYAFNNFQVEVIKDKAPLREGYYESKDIIKRYSKGTVLTVVGEKKNLWGNLWYKISGGGYIYSQNVKKVTKKHEHSYKFTRYGKMHPHLAEYECSCGSGYCGMETKKVEGCKECYPHVHSYKVTYGKAHPHYAEYECTCGHGYCGLEPNKVEGCNECYPHECNFKFVRYGKAHPHLAEYECSCGSGYCGLEANKVEGCKECYPHECNFKFVRYGKAHPHLAEYECSCGSGYCGLEANKVEGCEECYPHECNFKVVRYGKAHPHLAEYECSCGNGYCGLEPNKVEGCKECYPHECNFKFVRYGKAHPHYAEYECSCGSGYCGLEANKVEGCEECYPHEHEYIFAGYQKEHPHYVKYECECGSGRSGQTPQKQTGCNICYPPTYEDEDVLPHSCFFKDTGTYSFMHPHYAIEKCNTCKTKRLNMNKTKWIAECGRCNNPFLVPYGGYTDLTGRVFTVATNEVKPISKEDKKQISESIHSTLDVCGLAAPEPAAMVCDGVNVVYYLLQADFVNAGLSGMSFIPIVGWFTGGGKVVKKAGTAVIDATAKSADDILKVTTKVVIKNPDNISSVAGKIVKNADNYTDDVLKSVEKISNNKTVSLSEAFYKNDSLLSKTSGAKVTTDAGLSYGPYSKTKDNTLVHIIDRHNPTNKGTSTAGNFFKSTDNKKIFETIDDVYDNGELLAIGERSGNTSYYIKSSYEIGSDGEDILCIVFNGDTKNVVTAYPVYEVPQNVKYK